MITKTDRKKLALSALKIAIEQGTVRNLNCSFILNDKTKKLDVRLSLTIDDVVEMYDKKIREDKVFLNNNES